MGDVLLVGSISCILRQNVMRNEQQVPAKRRDVTEVSWRLSGDNMSAPFQLRIHLLYFDVLSRAFQTVSVVLECTLKFLKSHG